MTEKPHEQAVCARCGAAIDVADHFVVSDPETRARAFLCRTEHIVAWVMRGAAWDLDRPWEYDAFDRAAHGPVLLERIRAGQSTTLEFADAEELRSWASSGGFWSLD